MIVSPPIIEEIARVLRAKAAWEDERVLGRIKLLAKVAEVVRPTVTLRVVTVDPDDNRILECAVAGGAHLIVSGDRHLTRLRAFQGIAIMRPIDLLRSLGTPQ